MTITSSDTTYVDFTGPEGLRTRGTVLVVPGRGESQATYRRLGTRLAADSYRVRVLAAPIIQDTDVAGGLEGFAAALTDAVATVSEELPVRPLVLVGSDIGAVALGALVARSAADSAARNAAWWPDALVLAGLPGYAGHAFEDWNDELEVRTHCTVHRGVLTDDPSVHGGSLSGAVPSALLDAVYGSTVAVPQLLLIGDADPFADQDALARAAKALPTSRLTLVHGAHHDVLNDLQHRSVAAEVVTFLETLRAERSLEPILEVRSSSW